jgi:hypothetical protein
MGRKPKIPQVTDGSLGQHLALSVAVHLASSQLLPAPISVYDAQRARGVLNVIGDALARVVPLYVQDAGVAAPRPLLEGELDGCQVTRGATVLRLKDGRTLSTVLMKRGDLRHAIAVLKAVGIPELGDGATPKKPPKQEEPTRRPGELRAKVAEIEELVRRPFLPWQLDRVNALAISIARSAPDGRTANLAMRLLSAVHDARTAGDIEEDREIELMVAALRDAIHEADKGKG